jgi:CHASE3 domain sensor protein
MATKHRDIVVRLTEPQFDTVMAALDLYVQTMIDNEDGYSGRRAAVANRAADRLSMAWTRAGMGF